MKLNHGYISLQRARLHRTGKSRQLQPRKVDYKIKATVITQIRSFRLERYGGKGRYSPARSFRRKEPGSGGWNRQVGAEPKARPPPRGASQEPGVGVGRLVRGREGVAVTS